MSRFTGTDAAKLKEAYASIYGFKPEWVLNEETDNAVLILDEESGDYITEEFLNEQADLFIDMLIEEEFDFSKTTLNELSVEFLEYSLNEGWAQNLGANIRGGINKAAGAVSNVVGGAVNRAKDRIGASAQGLVGKRTTSSDPLARAGNFATRAATSGIRATGDFAKGLVTGKKGPSGPQKNLGTDIAGGLKKAGSALNKVSGGAGAAVGGAAAKSGNLVGKKVAAEPGQPPKAVGDAAAKAAKPDDGGRQAWLDKTKNSPAAKAGFSDDQRWKLQQKHRKWKADRSGGGDKTPAPTAKASTSAPAPKAASAPAPAPKAASAPAPAGTSPTVRSGQGGRALGSTTRRGGNTLGDAAAAASPSGVNRTQSVVRSGNKTTTTTRTSADSSTPEGQKAVNAAKAARAARMNARRNQNNSFDYDLESREGQLGLNVINVIADSMIHQGKTAYDVIEYLDTASVESITEMYLNYDEKVITESIIKEEYIDQQYEILNEGLWGGLLKGVAKIARPLVRGTKSLLGKGAGTAKQLTIPGTSRLALATSSAKNAISKVVKPVASKVKGLWSKIPGSVKGGAVGGYLGATLAGGGNKNQTPQTPGQGKGETKTPDTAATDVKKNIEKDSKKSQETSPKSGGYESGYGKAKTPGTDLSKSEYKLPAARRHPVSGNKPPANAVTGSGTEYDPWKTAVKKTYVKNSYQPEPFDLVMEHLLSTEQAANADEALYIMSEMDADAIQAIVDQK